MLAQTRKAACSAAGPPSIPSLASLLALPGVRVMRLLGEAAVGCAFLSLTAAGRPTRGLCSVLGRGASSVQIGA